MSSTNVANCIFCQSKSECFKKLGNDELGLVDQSKVEISFKKKEIIAKQGVFASHVMFVKQGLVKLYMEGDSGHNDVIVNFFPPGEVIGLSSVYGNSTFDFSVSAVEDSTLCLIEINVVRNLILTNGEFASQLIRRINETTLFTYRLLYDMTNRQMNGRIASALLHLAKEVFKAKRFKMTLSRKDLAEFTGMSTMSAIRVLNDLKSDGVISDIDGYIEILNIDTLEMISRTG